MTIQRLKILTIGSPNVGKSCLIKRYCEGRFSQDYIATIGIDYGVKPIHFMGDQINLDIWDTAGENVYYQIRNEFYKDLQAVIVVFDVTDRKSLLDVNYRMDEIMRFQDPNTAISGILVGNKVDKPRAVLPEEGKYDVFHLGYRIAGMEIARKYNLDYKETSSLNGNGVDDVFQCIFHKIAGKKGPE